MLRERFVEYQGTPRANCYWTGFEPTGEYNPDLGYGYILIGEDGLPAVHVWAHVDDFLLHGPTKEKVTRALKLFLDLSVDVGLLCNPTKITPPCQVVLYCGFLLDTRSVPCIRIPVAKRERALAMIEFILDSKPEVEFSRLALSVIAGTLEALVDATPNRLGHTYLREFYEIIHPEGEFGPGEQYYSLTPIPEAVRHALRWWQRIVLDDSGRRANTARAALLTPSWGDGSGTGTGGTIQIPGQPHQLQWMGSWSPTVFKFSSNWKELQTLVLTLERLFRDHSTDVAGTTVFYFTDNLVTYFITSAGSSRTPALHTLIRRVKELELALDLHLVVVHVPGVVMIQQGTDGLSRGIWATALHSQTDPVSINAAVFAPLQFDLGLVQWILNTLGQAGAIGWRYQAWDMTWDARMMFDTLNVWFPPPELARQVITCSLEAWCERPLTTSFLFVVPRVVTAEWQHLSRHLVEIGTFLSDDLCLRQPPMLPIPIVILYLPPHTRVLPPPRVDSPPVSAAQRWHRQQASFVRGLQPYDLAGDDDSDLYFPPPNFPDV
jgi:hypothetical protein